MILVGLNFNVPNPTEMEELKLLISNTVNRVTLENKFKVKLILSVNDYSSNDGYKWNNWSERKLKGKLMTLQCEPSGIL